MGTVTVDALGLDYSPDCRRQIANLVIKGENTRSVSKQFEISTRTLNEWVVRERVRQAYELVGTKHKNRRNPEEIRDIYNKLDELLLLPIASSDGVLVVNPVIESLSKSLLKNANRTGQYFYIKDDSLDNGSINRATQEFSSFVFISLKKLFFSPINFELGELLPDAWESFRRLPDSVLDDPLGNLISYVNTIFRHDLIDAGPVSESRGRGSSDSDSTEDLEDHFTDDIDRFHQSGSLDSEEDELLSSLLFEVLPTSGYPRSLDSMGKLSAIDSFIDKAERLEGRLNGYRIQFVRALKFDDESVQELVSSMQSHCINHLNLIRLAPALLDACQKTGFKSADTEALCDRLVLTAKDSFSRYFPANFRAQERTSLDPRWLHSGASLLKRISAEWHDRGMPPPFKLAANSLLGLQAIGWKCETADEALLKFRNEISNSLDQSLDRLDRALECYRFLNGSDISSIIQINEDINVSHDASLCVARFEASNRRLEKEIKHVKEGGSIYSPAIKNLVQAILGHAMDILCVIWLAPIVINNCKVNSILIGTATDDAERILHVFARRKEKQFPELSDLQIAALSSESINISTATDFLNSIAKHRSAFDDDYIFERRSELDLNWISSSLESDKDILSRIGLSLIDDLDESERVLNTALELYKNFANAGSPITWEMFEGCVPLSDPSKFIDQLNGSRIRLKSACVALNRPTATSLLLIRRMHLALRDALMHPAHISPFCATYGPLELKIGHDIIADGLAVSKIIENLFPSRATDGVHAGVRKGEVSWVVDLQKIRARFQDIAKGAIHLASTKLPVIGARPEDYAYLACSELIRNALVDMGIKPIASSSAGNFNFNIPRFGAALASDESIARISIYSMGQLFFDKYGVNGVSDLLRGDTDESPIWGVYALWAAAFAENTGLSGINRMEEVIRTAQKRANDDLGVAAEVFDVILTHAIETGKLSGAYIPAWGKYSRARDVGEGVQDPGFPARLASRLIAQGRQEKRDYESWWRLNMSEVHYSLGLEILREALDLRACGRLGVGDARVQGSKTEVGRLREEHANRIKGTLHQYEGAFDESKGKQKLDGLVRLSLALHDSVSGIVKQHFPALAEPLQGALPDILLIEIRKAEEAARAYKIDKVIDVFNECARANLGYLTYEWDAVCLDFGSAAALEADAAVRNPKSSSPRV